MKKKRKKRPRDLKMKAEKSDQSRRTDKKSALAPKNKEIPFLNPVQQFSFDNTRNIEIQDVPTSFG